MFKGFEPFYDKDCKVLILGSFPSVKSRQNGFYYGNPQNRFWKMLSTIFNENLPVSVEEKKNLLKKHNIALWDVVVESNLKGSADETLVHSKCRTISDLSPLLPPHTNVQKILCNGKTSFNLVVEKAKPTVPVIYVPSTSSANPSFKLEIWQKELSFLADDSGQNKGC